MPQASLLRRKAEEYKIEIDESTALWSVRVCKRMLEGYFSLLRLSHKKVIPEIERVEEELLEIKNLFEDLLDTSEATVLIEKGHIHSMINLSKEVRSAYIKICVALTRNNDKNEAENNQKEEGKAAGDKVIAQCVEDISRNLFDCQDAISQALKCFDSEFR